MKASFLTIHLMIVAVAGIFHKEPPLCCGWTDALEKIGVDSTYVTVIVHCKENNLERLSQIASEVSDPVNPRYGSFLSQRELDDLTAPDAAHVSVVHDWLKVFSTDILLHRNRTFVAKLNVRKAEVMLSTKFRPIVHEKNKQQLLRGADYVLPNHIEDAVGAVFGVHGLSAPQSQKSQSTPVSASATNVTPAVISRLYNVTQVGFKSSSGNKQAVGAFVGQLFNQSDLNQFFATYLPQAPMSDAAVKVVGDSGTGPAGGEASLDVQ